jgi:WD domain, G-beta repeat
VTIVAAVGSALGFLGALATRVRAFLGSSVSLWPRRHVRPAARGHTGRVQSCAFSPDGVLLATASHDWTVRLWRVADGAEQAERLVPLLPFVERAEPGTAAEGVAAGHANKPCRDPEARLGVIAPPRNT